MAKEIKVKSVYELKIVFNLIKEMLRNRKKVFVSIKTSAESLSDKQRGLYWLWLEDIAADQQDNKVDLHWHYKERFLLPIFLADVDNPNHFHIHEAWRNLQIVRRERPDMYQSMLKLIVSGVSIQDSSKDNMLEYLKEIDRHASSLGIRLRRPEDRYYAAMGIKPPKVKES